MSATDSEKIYIRRSSGLVRSVSSRQAFFANLVSMGILGPVLYVLYASGSAPTGDIPLTTVVGLIIVLFVAYTYWMLSTSMPRTGGDYIWTSRILHPFVGFLESSMLLFVMITSFVSYDIYLAVTNGLSYVFINFGYLTNNSSLINTGISLLSDHLTILLVSIVLALLVIGVMMLPIKRIVMILFGMFFATLIVYIIYAGLLVGAGNSGFVSTFNTAAANSTYQAIASATNSDYTLGGTLFIGLVFVMLSYIGFVNSSYFAGEVSGDPFKSQGLAIFGAPIIYGGFLFTMYFLQFTTYGHAFLASAASLFFGGSSSWPTFGLASGLGQPSGVFLVNFLTSNPYLSALVAFGIFLQFVMWGMVFFLAPTRYIFSWSFDRILPVRFSATTKKGVPYVAVLLYGVLTIIFVAAAVYTSILSYYAYAIFGFYLSTTIVLIGGALFPYRRKDIFDASHRYVRAKIAGIPVMTIVGLVGALFSAITMVVTVLPAYTGFPIQLSYFIPIVVVLVAATILYWVSYYYNKSKGLPVDLVGKEIPPL